MSEASLHRRIRADVQARILSGEWPPGHRIPAEHELMADYGCSRMTVNKALGPLTEAGLIERRRRAGSFVARPKIHSAVLDIPDIAAEVAARGEAYGYELLAREERPANDEEARALDLDPAAPVLALRCLHRAAGRPFALEERLVNLAAVPEARAVDFERTPPGSWLLGHVPWTEAEHRIGAAAAGRVAAKTLGISTGAACLVLHRRTWRGSERITDVRMTFPGDAYDLVARFTPSQT
ncbi:histidine utilization repressor [Phenylobacterium sp. J426]|uniref:histidine utilization repressor n=1 Tax=Phenylobacterium sp. J426 TaxID=2898439 RepID=UPI0021514005|nr:histidine utilization repressor [Phenylobacterium sp. J426]MCR5873394.1 histidine utilization repressor [Phenylobacterium sp. J426]